MKALCWHGRKDIRDDTVPDPRIEDPRDAVVRVTGCAICGSDLHLSDGVMPGMACGGSGRIRARAVRRRISTGPGLAELLAPRAMGRATA